MSYERSVTRLVNQGISEAYPGEGSLVKRSDMSEVEPCVTRWNEVFNV